MSLFRLAKIPPFVAFECTELRSAVKVSALLGLPIGPRDLTLGYAGAKKDSFPHRRKEGPAMHRRNARRSGHWIRQNLSDGWQVVGTIGLLFGMFAFAILIGHSRHVLPSTGSAIQLIQTFVSNSPLAKPSVELTDAPAPSPSPSPQVAVIQPAPATHVWRPPTLGVAPAPMPAPSATPAPTPPPAPTPSPRLCIQKVCPTTSPTPTPSAP